MSLACTVLRQKNA